MSPRLCEMNSDEAPVRAVEILDQCDDAGFHGDVERGRRLVEDQQLAGWKAAPSR